MIVSIIGSGAIGMFYGTLLIDAGEEVHFLCRSDYETVKEKGIFIESKIRGNKTFENIHAHKDVSSIPVSDIVIVSLKTTENEKLLPILLPPILKKETTIILIQNGLGVEADVAKLFPDQQIIGGLAFISSSKVAPGHILHIDHGNLSLGYFNHINEKNIQTIVEKLNQQNIKVTLSDELNKLRWRKLIWNIAFNGMTVILGCQTDKIMQSKDLIELSKEIMEEVISGAKSCGAELDVNLTSQMIQYTIDMPAYSPSMKLDYDHRRLMEIHYIYEEPVRIAKEAGYYMSKVDMLTKQLKFKQQFEY